MLENMPSCASTFDLRPLAMNRGHIFDMLKKPYELFFGTLANNQRLEILNLLRKGPRNVTQICKKLKFNQTTVSHNLRKLKTCSFVFVKKNGKERIYEINGDTIKPLMILIDKHTNKFCKHLCYE